MTQINLTKKRPWNRVNLPVYSISSKGESGFNMNIVTYATQISMSPKRFICGVYEGTRTLTNILENDLFVLQLLSSEQHRLITLLGKQSGNKIDKIKRLEKRNETIYWRDFPVLKNCIAVMEMKIISKFNAGDHMGVLCDVVSYENLHPHSALNLDILREKKLIRI